jgi:hypothetical protein
MMRKHFENLTGVATGSDQLMRHGANIILQLGGFLGEGVVDNTTWIKKTHFPCCIPFNPIFDGEAMVICVRNPLDCSPSLLYLCYSMMHDESFANDLTKGPIFEHWKVF